MLKRVRSLAARVSAALEFIQRASIAQRREYYERLREIKRQRSTKILSGHGYKVYSQFDEDGIIQEIFRRVGTTSRMFVEFGVGDGLENNTLALLYGGWKGLWIEGSSAYCERIRERLAPAIDSAHLRLINAFVTPENIDSLIGSVIAEREIDLLSIDIDGNDAHVLSRITAVSPRVIVLEYNARFGPSISYCMSPDPEHMWRKTDRFGASLKYFEQLLRGQGYECVGCSLAGTNAFFVRKELLKDHFDGPYTAEHQFEPARYELLGLPSGHPAGSDTFRTRVAE
jgi:hypothetical protein